MVTTKLDMNGSGQMLGSVVFNRGKQGTAIWGKQKDTAKIKCIKGFACTHSLCSNLDTGMLFLFFSTPTASDNKPSGVIHSALLNFPSLQDSPGAQRPRNELLYHLFCHHGGLGNEKLTTPKAALSNRTSFPRGHVLSLYCSALLSTWNVAGATKELNLFHFQ